VTLTFRRPGRSTGGAVLLKFSLAGDPALEPVACDSLRSRPAPGDLAGRQPMQIRGLKYAQGTGWYHAVWKSGKAWEGRCGAPAIQLDDRTEQMAYF
jgi:hypothetical protein